MTQGNGKAKKAPSKRKPRRRKKETVELEVAQETKDAHARGDFKSYTMAPRDVHRMHELSYDVVAQGAVVLCEDGTPVSPDSLSAIERCLAMACERRAGTSMFVPHRLIVLFEALRNGAKRPVAARAAGIPIKTWHKWFEAGEHRMADPDHYSDQFHRRGEEFVSAVEEAEAQFVTRSLARIAKAGESPHLWTANAWLLERVYPEEFGRRLEIKGKVEHEKVYSFEEPPLPMRMADGTVIDLNKEEPAEWSPALIEGPDDAGEE